jgi:NAD(P)-dependent dehydrogenase (short-subunit alcohol dehydrogenase family)
MLILSLPSGGEMNDSPILKDKRSVIFGAGGSIGAAVARTFAAEGAEVFLAGRGKSSVEAVAREITESGGRAHVAVVDVLDDPSVDKYLEEVVEQAGGIDVQLNATGPRAADYGTGTPAVDLPIEQFLVGQSVLTGQFITARCAARHMVTRGAGVIIFLTGSPARPHSPGTVAIGAANGGIENITRSMALELAGTGVRVVCLRTAANPDSRTIQDVVAGIAAGMKTTKDEVFASLADATMLKVSPRTEDTASAAVLLASDRARMMTGTVHNATAGATPD